MNKPESAIANQVSNFGHRMNFDATSMIFKSPSLNRRHIVESAFICSNKDKALNLNLGFSPHNKLLSKYINDVIITYFFNFYYSPNYNFQDFMSH